MKQSIKQLRRKRRRRGQSMKNVSLEFQERQLLLIKLRRINREAAETKYLKKKFNLCITVSSFARKNMSKLTG